ncbi:MAG: 2-amino-4-hydroxy-6-hydroxymethyldihydropteridine diphosphokinase [Hyphomicrobiaceae bacterium]|nr:2-amino-4-hydroxy-6-hydroxymethyldihydropteridine diphosphokinase [Hyphomicrobiaceae bacterium]
MTFDAIIALGSNIGDKRANIAAALAMLVESGEVRIVARSRDFKTPPWGKTDQPWFVNACAGVETSLAPRPLLQHCLAIERRLGRIREEKWGPRIIDLDVLVHRAGAVDEPDLVLPHPRISERAFVLAPLADIAPALVLNGRSIVDWLDGIDQTGVEPFDDGDAPSSVGG